jgi:cytochrome c-type biogenesis protein CcmH/NrfF
MRRAAPVVAAAIAAAILAPPSLAVPALVAAPALAATPQVSISEIEGEVMCPVCGTLLELADSPQARREKAYVARLIAAGRTRAEIKDALVTQYGDAVLALPKGSGFDLSAYLVPVVGFAVAAAALAVGVARWRRRPGSGPGAPPAPPGKEDSERLDADIGRYDL